MPGGAIRFPGLCIVGAVCARGGSKGVPRKNIKAINGMPLIGHAIRCAQATSIFEAIVVSTDDAVIAAIGQAFGAEVPFLRPPELARDDSPKWPVFRHLVENWEAGSGRRIDILVDLDIGVPLRAPEDIVNCVDVMLKGEAEVVGTAYEAERNPYFNMVELAPDGFATIVKPVRTPIAARQHAPQVFSLSPSVIAVRRHALWKHEHWSQAKFQVHVVPRERAIDIDTDLDFRFVEFLMAGAAAGRR